MVRPQIYTSLPFAPPSPPSPDATEYQPTSSQPASLFNTQSLQRSSRHPSSTSTYAKAHQYTLSPTAVSPGQPSSDTDFYGSLSFAKIKIPSSTTPTSAASARYTSASTDSAGLSTDSEFSSDYGADIPQDLPPQGPCHVQMQSRSQPQSGSTSRTSSFGGIGSPNAKSPSLLSSMFQSHSHLFQQSQSQSHHEIDPSRPPHSQPIHKSGSGSGPTSRDTSSAASGAPQPVTPVSATIGPPPISRSSDMSLRCKPILRRDTVHCTSGQTSASEDYAGCDGRQSERQPRGLGLVFEPRQGQGHDHVQASNGNGTVLGEKHSEMASTAASPSVQDDPRSTAPTSAYASGSASASASACPSTSNSAAPSRQCSLKFAVKPSFPSCSSSGFNTSSGSIRRSGNDAMLGQFSEGNCGRALSSALQDAINATKGSGPVIGRNKIRRYPHLDLPVETEEEEEEADEDAERMSTSIHRRTSASATATAKGQGNGLALSLGLAVTAELDEDGQDQDDSESDEGYQEDSESGGFTSDEEDDDNSNDNDDEDDEDEEDDSYFTTTRSYRPSTGAGAGYAQVQAHGYPAACIEKWTQAQAYRHRHTAPYSPSMRKRTSTLTLTSTSTSSMNPAASAVRDERNAMATPIYHSTTDDNSCDPSSSGHPSISAGFNNNNNTTGPASTTPRMGRKISIADLKINPFHNRDKCSKHVSPPPISAQARGLGDVESDLELDDDDDDEDDRDINGRYGGGGGDGASVGHEDEEVNGKAKKIPGNGTGNGSERSRSGTRRKIKAPPAARSPSAAGLARRRSSHHTQQQQQMQPQTQIQVQVQVPVQVQVQSGHVQVNAPRPQGITARSGNGYHTASTSTSTSVSSLRESICGGGAGSVSASSSVGKCIRGFQCTPLPKPLSQSQPMETIGTAAGTGESREDAA